MLVDCGAGVASSWWPFEGFRSDTETALADAGVSPGDVGLVVLTHLDYDHAGGLLQGVWPHDLRLAFPRASVAIHRDAVEAARSADPDECTTSALVWSSCSTRVTPDRRRDGTRSRGTFASGCAGPSGGTRLRPSTAPTRSCTQRTRSTTRCTSHILSGTRRRTSSRSSHSRPAVASSPNWPQAGLGP